MTKTVPLRRLVDVIDCAHVTAEFVDDDRRFPVASIRECQGPYVDLSNCNYTTPEFFEHLRAGGRAPRVGDLLFIRNVSVGLVSAVEPGTPEFAVGQETVLLRRTSDVDPLFLRYALVGSEVVHAIESAMIGTTFRRINVAAIRGLPIALPVMEEQRAIADYLDRETSRIDTLIEEQQRLIEILRERRVAAIATRLGGLEGLTRLKHVSTVQTGVTLSGQGDPADPEWPYLRVANVQVGYVDLREIKTVRVPHQKAAVSMLQPGDVLMTEGGDIDKLGRGALWHGDVPDMLHQNHIFAVRPTKDLDSEFLVYWLDGPVARTYFRTTAKQTTNLAGTNKWTLGNLPVPVPPLAEQRGVVHDLDEQTAKIDALILEAQRFIELSRERRAALITAAVTGQIDVREVA